MIIIHLVGGFGNQLYCYALYEKLKSLGKDVKLDVGDYLPGARFPEKRDLELAYLKNLPYEVCTPKEREKLTDDGRSFFARLRRKFFGSKANIYREPEKYDASVFDLDNVYLDGYWNSEAYFADRISQLQKDIQFPVSDIEKNNEYAKKMQDEESVFLHIRRSDYLDPSCIDRYKDICTEEYYRSALELVRECHEKHGNGKPLTIYLFSDEPEYVRRQYADLQAQVVDWNTGKDSFYDCMLMSKCKYHICANSTFSMWAARLSTRQDKVMIRPLFVDRYEKITAEEVREQWPDWVLIDPKGKIYE